MGQNPFLNAKSDAEVEKLIEDASAAAHPPGGTSDTPEPTGEAITTPKAPEEDEPVDSTEDLFGGEGDDDDVEVDADAEDDDDEPLFGEDDEDAETEEKPAKKEPETVPYKRLVKVLKQRTELQTELGELKAQQSAFIEAYSEYDDPVKQMKWDSNFATSAEKLAAALGDPSKVALSMILHHMETGEIPKMNAQAQTTPAPKPDARVDRIVEREATRVIESTLPENMRPGVRAVAIDYIRGNASDLADLDAKQVTTLLREFIKEKGFTKDDVFAPPAKKDETKAVVTSSGQRRPAVATTRPAPAKKAEAAADAADAKVKTLEEWEARREERIRAFGNERTL